MRAVIHFAGARACVGARTCFVRPPPVCVVRITIAAWGTPSTLQPKRYEITVLNRRRHSTARSTSTIANSITDWQ